jgi:MerR family mercuric resistance operon transcriptional regulator
MVRDRPILKLRKIMKELTIGALAKAAGVNVETIRFYERRGLLRRPSRPEEGYRRYPIDAVKQVGFIKGAQKLGFSLKEIAELLSLGREGQVSCAEMLDLANRKISKIVNKIMTLEVIKAALGELSEICPGSNALGPGILPFAPFGSGWRSSRKERR